MTLNYIDPSSPLRLTGAVDKVPVQENEHSFIMQLPKKLALVLKAHRT